MRISKACKAIFIMVNHGLATLIPHDLGSQILGMASTDDVGQPSTGQPDGGSTLASASLFTTLFGRQANRNPKQDDAPACQRCRKKCSKRFIKRPDNCRKCMRCPKGQKGNFNSTKCIGEDEKDEEELDCPKGQKPNADQSKCIDENDLDCPKGQKPNVDQSRCIGENELDCPKGQKPNTGSTKCIGENELDCPKGQKPDPSSTKCVGENDKDGNDKEKQPEDPKNGNDKDKQPEIPKDGNDKDKQPEAPKDGNDKQPEAPKDGNDKQPEAPKDDKDKGKDPKSSAKTKIMGRCLMLVPLALGGVFASEFAGDFFDEAFLEQSEGDMLKFWPEDLEVPGGDEDEEDDVFEDDSFIEKWVAFGEKNTNDSAERDLDAVNQVASFTEAVSQTTSTQLMARETQEIEERFLPFIPLLGFIFNMVTRVGPIMVRVGPKLMRILKKPIGVGKGRSSPKSFKEQGDGVAKIAKDGGKHWRSCLSGKPPV